MARKPGADCSGPEHTCKRGRSFDNAKGGIATNQVNQACTAGRIRASRRKVDAGFRQKRCENYKLKQRSDSENRHVALTRKRLNWTGYSGQKKRRPWAAFLNGQPRAGDYSAAAPASAAACAAALAS